MSDILEINSVDLNARGISRHNSKVIFVDGALPGEKVIANTIKKNKSYDIAVLKDILEESPYRVNPVCNYFGICGGCLMQHISINSQVSIKQRALEDSFTHIAKTHSDVMLQPLNGLAWNYRSRARLSVKFIEKKSSLLVGFRERNNSFVTDMTDCPILHPNISALILHLREVIAKLSIYRKIPQIEVAIGDNLIVHLIVRVLDILSYKDKLILINFENLHNVKFCLHSNDNKIYELNPINNSSLYYSLPEFGISIFFNANDFTQVNHSVNRIMVSKVISLLNINRSDSVLELFCGLGNFSLPLATKARRVLSVDVSENLISRAVTTSKMYNLDSVVNFLIVDLFSVDHNWFAKVGYFDLMLLDPPRDGAFSIVKALSFISKKNRPRRIVYVSCNSSTLSRDIKILVHDCGYFLKSSGIINMFSHTGHVESISLLEL